jgi:hypothetical protein
MIEFVIFELDDFLDDDVGEHIVILLVFELELIGYFDVVIILL